MSETPGYPVHGPRDDLPDTRPPRPAVSGHLVGRVVASSVRVEAHGHEFGSETVPTFRLAVAESHGPRDVQVRGRSISGTIQDGDRVEVDAGERGDRLEVALVRNLTTGAEVRASGGSSTSPLARSARVVFVLAFVVVLLIIVWGAWGIFGVVDDGWPFGGGGFFGGAG